MDLADPRGAAHDGSSDRRARRRTHPCHRPRYRGRRPRAPPARPRRTTARCGFTAWHSHIICIDWFEERICPVCLADLALDLGAEIPADVLAELDELAAPWPGRWLLRPRECDRERVVGVCAGPGGWDEGLEALGARYDAVGLDLSSDACATAERAGHRGIVIDITLLDPEHPALRWTVGVIISPPCPAWSTAGKRAGLTAQSLQVLAAMLRAAGEAAGHGGYRDRSGMTCTWRPSAPAGGGTSTS
ncbi:DNA cytosine methyltransferase [Streptomyces sp. NPDC094049]|uniref:DNA cytosine methyltransferase n=1 Tax=Streptomyces sp. NPDC094049 TaxID=3154987 RepID=UPI00332D6D0C